MAAVSVTARDANQRFSQLLREVDKGQEFVVTLRGRAVARLVPVEANGRRVLTAEQEAALERTLARKWHLGNEPFDRDSLHER